MEGGSRKASEGGGSSDGARVALPALLGAHLFDQTNPLYILTSVPEVIKVTELKRVHASRRATVCRLKWKASGPLLLMCLLLRSAKLSTPTSHHKAGPSRLQPSAHTA